MLVTLLGIMIEVKVLQYQKAPSPMFVTLYVLPLYFTVSGITISPEYELLEF